MTEVEVIKGYIHFYRFEFSRAETMFKRKEGEEFETLRFVCELMRDGMCNT